MRIKYDVVLRDCIENGIKRGYRRAFKHVENPDENSIFQHLEEAIMGEIYEYFDFHWSDQ
jgi:hypothetical protein